MHAQAESVGGALNVPHSVSQSACVIIILIIMLNAIMLNVILLNVTAPKVFLDPKKINHFWRNKN
jgi:hypothetical protein